MARPAQAIINLKALRHNFQLAASLCAPGLALAVVKANAYGHGAVPVAQALADLAPAFGVACIEEALELRAAGIKVPILLLEGIFSPEEVSVAAEQNFWLMLENDQQFTALESANVSKALKVWLKVDTGMHRLGLSVEDLEPAYRRMQACKNVDKTIVVATHFACGDDLESEMTDQQTTCLRDAARDLGAPLSLANSPGILGWPQARAEWNRPGFMLYGNSPFAVAQAEADKLQAVMTLRSAIISLREIAVGESVGYAASWTAARPSKIATVAMGYGDGYPRQAPSGSPVLVNGVRVSLVGRVSMDMVTLDVTDLDSVALGDEVIFWGESLSANEVAEHAGTIGYEVLTRMPMRTPRVYVE